MLAAVAHKLLLQLAPGAALHALLKKLLQLAANFLIAAHVHTYCLGWARCLSLLPPAVHVARCFEGPWQ